MHYEGALYRPPSEARSIIIQATIGCAHNKCTFCSMYKDKKFRIRNLEDILADLHLARKQYKRVKRIFLADGNALIIKKEILKYILKEIKQLFPECERVGVYGAPKDILRKNVGDLKELNQLGLKIIYLGLESGSDKILNRIKKDVTPDEMVKAGNKVMDAGIKLSVTVISGLGGKKYWKEHALESAKVLNKINPDYLGLLTLLIQDNTDLNKEIKDNKFELLSPKEVLLETKTFIENLELTNCIFRSNHPSNYVSLVGNLSDDKNLLLEEINIALKENFDYKDELYRRL